MFTIAHFSDVHLPPLPAAGLRALMGKRLSGYLSWKLNRRKIHRPEVLASLMADIAAHKPDHLAFTGDVVNIALDQEFTNAFNWLSNLADPRDLTMVPGNHDAYTEAGFSNLLNNLSPFMLGDKANMADATPNFPFVRYRRNIAIIGLSSALPTPVFQAWGELGAAQLAETAKILRQTREQGFARVVMIHHPPLRGLAKPRKALKDADGLAAILQAEGAEIVLHGHNHLLELHHTPGPQGYIPCLGVPSASARAYPGHPSAAWALLNLRRKEGQWLIDAQIRRYDEKQKQMLSAELWNLRS